MIYERAGSMGDWSIRLSDATPWSVRSSIVEISTHVVVTPTWVSPGRTDAQMLEAALFTGVVLRPGSGQLDIGGVGPALWLGYNEPRWTVLETAVYHVADTLSTFVTSLLPPALGAGTVTSPGGTLTAKYQWVSNRQALDSVCDRFGVEWRVNPDLTLDVATADTLYGATPVALVMPGESGRDATMLGMAATFDVTVDFDDFATKVIVVGKGADYGAGGASATYRDGFGNFVVARTLVESPDTPLGYELEVANTLLAQVSTAARQITARTPAFAPTFDVPVGSYIYAYDPDNDLIDTDNRVLFRGRDRFPLLLRVYGCRWPVRAGMGVYARTHNGSSAEWTDLTPWIEFEDGDAELEVGWPARVGPDGTLSNGSAGLTVPLMQTPWEPYTPSWTCNSGTNPSIGNGSLTGAWRRDGTTLHVWVHTVAGSTTTFGSGSFWYWSLPSGMTAMSGAPQMGAGQVLDSGVDRWGCTSLCLAGDTKMLLLYDNAEVGPTAPIGAPGSGDEWSISMTLEIEP